MTAGHNAVASGREPQLTLVSVVLTAPDHEALRPFRFVLIEGEGRLHLSQAFVQIRKRSHPRVGAHDLARTWRKTMRAPALIGVVARLVHDHPKVPVHEQYLTVGAAIQGILSPAMPSATAPSC